MFQFNTDNYEEIMKGDEGIDFENYSLEEEINKYDGVKPSGWQILVRVFVPKRITKLGSIELPEETIAKMHGDAKVSNLTGLVIKFAPGVYQDRDRYLFTGPYCSIGDWVQFPRAEGYSFSHNNMTSLYISEDKILGVVDDPRTIKRITY